MTLIDILQIEVSKADKGFATENYALKSELIRTCRKLAQEYVRQGKYREAEREYKKAIETDQNSITAHRDLLKFYIAQKRFQEAEEIFKRLATLEPEGKLFLGLTAER